MNGMSLSKNFGRRIQQIRTGRGLTQQELSELVNCSTEYISRIERGLCSPSFDMITRLAKALIVDPKDFFDLGIRSII
jgi:transcriptional regulator with XRE-family HTH domain